MNEKAIEILFTITKVQNLTSGGFRATIDFPGASQASYLLQKSDSTGILLRGVIAEDDGSELPEWLKKVLIDG